MNRRDLLILISSLAVVPHSALAATSFTDNPQVATFIQQMREEHAFEPMMLEDFFSRLTVNQKVLRLVGSPSQKPTKKSYWREYRKRRLTTKNIAQGVRFLRRHDKVLQQAETQYGVSQSIITAIVSVETRYGEYLGDFLVAEALATLAFNHQRRGEEFRQELLAFLLYTREAQTNPLSIRGSYAGAFGIPQFLPSSLRQFAVDFDNSGSINLFSVTDSIGSIGNFLQMHGWRRETGVSYPVEVVGDAQTIIDLMDRHDYKPVLSQEALTQLGVHVQWGGEKAAQLPATEQFVFIDLENRYDTEYRVGTDNFYALTRYNKSFKYASTVFDLATAIEAAL